VLDHVVDLSHFFGEIARAVAPGGAAVLSVMHPAMLLRGVSARFTDPESGQKIAPMSMPHVLSDYVMAAVKSGMVLEHLSEHAVDDALAATSERIARYVGWPILVLMRLRRGGGAGGRGRGPPPRDGRRAR
jgi:malonyl-CoA O-methyltransferase